GLGLRVARRHRGTAGGVALHDEEFALAWVAARAVLQLVGHAGTGQAALAADDVARLFRRLPGLRGGDSLLDDLVGLGGVLEEPLGQAGVGGLLHERADGDVAELRLRLPLELRLTQADRDDGGEALTDVLAEEVVVLLL